MVANIIKYGVTFLSGAVLGAFGVAIVRNRNTAIMYAYDGLHEIQKDCHDKLLDMTKKMENNDESVDEEKFIKLNELYKEINTISNKCDELYENDDIHGLERYLLSEYDHIFELRNKCFVVTAS